MGILTPNPTNIYATFYPSNSMECFSNQNHFAVCCCQVNIFLHQSYELQRAKFHTTQSACIACQDSKLKRKREFWNTHKAKGHQICSGQQSAHTLCLRHKRKVSHYTVRIPMTSGPVLHVRTQNWKERKELEHSPTKRTPKVQWSAVSTQPMTPRSWS